MRRCAIFLLLLGSAFICHSQNSQQWLRYPRISPDGRSIAFTWHGDIYTVASSGGTATPLFADSANQIMPVWSRNSKQLAFAANNAGNFDVYIKKIGSNDTVKRLTCHSADEYPYDFTADNNEVLFGAVRMDDRDSRQFPSDALQELYAIPRAGGRIRQVLTTPAEDARMSDDGKWLLYHDRKGRENPWRKHQLSSVARDIWLYNLATGKHVMISSFAGEDRNAVFIQKTDDIYYLSERNGSFNVYQQSLKDTSSCRQVTFYKNNPVRFLSIADNGTICYGYDGQIFTRKKNGLPVQVRIKIVSGNRGPAEITVPADNVHDVAVSPSGEEFAYVSRGEVFVASLTDNTVKQITHTACEESNPNFSADGKELVYASERNNRWEIIKTSANAGKSFCNADSIKEIPLIQNEHENYLPKYSPDGKEVAYIEDKANLKIYNIASGKIRSVLSNNELFSRRDNDQYFEWSPDGKWLLVQYSEQGAGNDEVGVVSSSGSGNLINITRSGYNDTKPKWVMGGKMITWFSDRQGLQSYAGSADKLDVYGATVENDNWADIRERKQRLTDYPVIIKDALLSGDGRQLYYFARLEKKYDLWVEDVETKTIKKLLPLNADEASMVWGSTRKDIVMVTDGKVSRYDPELNKIYAIDTKTDLAINPSEERSAMFEHVWRRTKEAFYEKGLHGTNWDLLKTVYKKYLTGINNNYDFSEMMNEMLGELNVSHTGASWSDPRQNKDITASLGVICDQHYMGKGAKILEVLKGGPLDSAHLHIKSCDIILSVDGREIGAENNIEEFLNQKARKNVVITVEQGGQSKRMVIKPITPDAENDLLYNRWVKRNEAETDSLSKGAIGYVHLYRMNDAVYRNMYEDVMGKYNRCKALVVDTRFNRGGDLATELYMFLTGVAIRQNTTDGILVSTEPSFRWTKPSILLANEANYSDGHCFAFDYKYLHLGKLVGMPIPGSCTWMTGETLQDNSMHYSVPTLGVKAPDGRFMENQQTAPDIEIMNDYESAGSGTDKQLEAAIKEMEQELLTNK